MVQENLKTRVYPGSLWLVTLSALACAAYAGGAVGDVMAQEKATVLAHRISIDVVKGTVVAGSNGGNVRGSRHPRVTWTSQHDFTLEFFLVQEEGAPPRAGVDPRWPFREPKPKGGIVTLEGGASFEGTIKSAARKEEEGVYKYYITVTTRRNEVYRLDPIIIMD